MTLPEILTPRELADHLRVSEATIRNMANRGDIPEGFRVGKSWRFHREAVTRLAPKPVTLAEWQDADAQQSEPTNEPPAGGVSSGEKTGGNAKSAGTRTKRRRSTGRTNSGSAFARDFPEHASIVRSAS